MNKRVKKLIEVMGRHGVDSLLITNAVDVRYLTQYGAEDAWLVVSSHKAFYITDSRYAEAVRKDLKGFSIRIFKNSLAGSVFQIAQSLKVKKLWLDPRHVSLSQFRVLKSKMVGKVKLVEKIGLVEILRMQKEIGEVSYIQKALGIHKEALVYLKRIIKPGISEKEVASRLESFVKRRDCSFSFDPIIASGSHSSLPHAHVTSRKIRLNEPILVDIGIDYKGYKSDLTRMFFLGKISNLISDINIIVREAQQQAIDIIRPGIKASEVDAQARNYLQKKKLAKYFGHSLGHGVGLEIHENPRLSSKDKTVLQEGMVLTVEPGVYLPGKFGIRIEDMVLVTQRGRKVLSDNID